MLKRQESLDDLVSISIYLLYFQFSFFYNGLLYVQTVDIFLFYSFMYWNYLY